MAEDNTLTKALVDVRARRSALQSDYEHMATELAKLRAAEAALASIVEGVPLEAARRHNSLEDSRATRGDRIPSEQGGRRGARGPRASSAKGRLKALLGSAGPQGLSHAEIVERLPDVAPNTLNTYLSMMVTGGEAVRNGEFYTARLGTEGAYAEVDPIDEVSEVEDGRQDAAAAE